MTTRAQVTFHNISGLPEDDYVNTFHFGSIAQGKYGAGVVETILADFYNGTTGQTHALTAHMSELVSRSTDADIKLYDLNDPEPRVPYSTASFTPVAPHGSELIPAEVAAVISWKAAPVSGVPLGRLRGRTYIGPLLVDAVQQGAPNDGRPTLELREDMAAAAERLIGAGTADLVIYSRTSIPEAAHSVVGGFVDNAFDILRSRGAAPTSRILLTP